MTPEQFIDLLEKLIGKQLQKKMFHLGKIASIDGDRASVYIDGSTIPTPNVPYNPNIKFNAGEEVWVVFINFDPNDKFILCKRGTEPPDPPSSGEDMQVHGNEWHTTAFETVAGAQEKVDTHADSKSTHGVGSNYIAKTTNPNQWPLWTEIENKPSEFPPSAHSHNLDEITETEGKKIMTAEERTKLEGIEPGANKYIHPETHPASMIIETSSKRFVSDTEKANWNAKETPSGAQAKADAAEANAKSYTDIHDQNTTKHITATERTNWNDANAKKHTHSNKSILDTITQTLINTWNSAVDHISDAVKHITSAERARWNAKQDALGYTPVNKAGDSMTGSLAVEHTTFPVVDIIRNTSSSGGNVYGGARMVRKTTNPANGVGIGFYFQAPNSNKVITYAGMFGGALGTIAAGSEKGEIVFGPSYAGQDPYKRRDLVIRAISASKAEAELNGKLRTDQTEASDSADTVATKKYVDTNIPTKVSQLENDRGYVTQEELGDVGYSDMLKSVYDTNDDGKVDVAETVIGNEIQLGSYKLVYNSTTNSLDVEVLA